MCFYSIFPNIRREIFVYNKYFDVSNMVSSNDKKVIILNSNIANIGIITVEITVRFVFLEKF